MNTKFLKFGIIILIIISCSKERLVENETNTAAFSLEATDEFLDLQKQQEQVYIVDSPENGINGPIIAEQGTKIWAHKGIFMYPNGDNVHYPFEIRIIEIYKPADMIYAKMPTTSDNKILKSGGEIRVKAYKDDTELVLRPSAELKLEFPTNSSDNNMRVFYGQELNNGINWINSNDSIQISDNYYTIFSHKLNWLNCDYFYDSQVAATNINVECDSVDLSQIRNFAYFDVINSLMQINNFPSSDIPVGESVKLIGIGKKDNGELYYYYIDTVTSTSSNYHINDLIQTSTNELDSLLNTL